MKTITMKRYSEAIKQQVVSEHEGRQSVQALRHKHGITGNGTIERWVKKYSHAGLRHELVVIQQPDERKLEKRLKYWEDVLVYIGAHEARHIWQFQRRRRTGKRGKGEYDADKFSYSRLNDWRAATGRSLIPQMKQPNPFATR